MPLPIVIVVGAVVIGAYKLGRFFKKERECDLENRLSVLDAIHVKEKQELDVKLKKSRKEVMEELVNQYGKGLNVAGCSSVSIDGLKVLKDVERTEKKQGQRTNRDA